MRDTGPEQIVAAQKRQIKDLTAELAEETSERRRMATLRWEAEECFRNMLCNSPFPIHLYDLVGEDSLVLSGANQAADRVLQLDHALVMGKPVEQIFSRDAGPELLPLLRDVVKIGSPLRMKLVCKSGSSGINNFNLHAFMLSPHRMAAIYYPQNEGICQPGTSLQPDQPEAILVVSICDDHDDQPDQETTAEASSSQGPTVIKPLSIEDISYTDLFMVEELQDIQDAFAAATNQGSIITHPDGRPITQPSNFCRLCQRVIRSTPKGKANCERSDAIIGCRNPSGPTMRVCYSGGLWDGGASICVGQKHIASWLVGQVRDNSISDEHMLAYAREIGADEQEFMEALKEVPSMSYDHFSSVCKVLYLFANQMSELALQNVLQARSIVARQEAEAKLRRSRARLHHLSAKLIMAQEEERKQLALELHDGIGQSLTAAKYCVDNVQQVLGQGRSAKEALKAAANVLKTSIKDVRRMQAALRPKMLDDLGVLATLNWFCREFQTIYGSINLEWKLNANEDDIPAMLKPVIYRICQEALNNAAKHSEAATVRLLLQHEAGEISLIVEDNGKGFDLRMVMDNGDWRRVLGLGLESMRERAELMGGSFSIDTTPGMGTIVRARWKL